MSPGAGGDKLPLGLLSLSAGDSARSVDTGYHYQCKKGLVMDQCPFDKM